MAHTFAERRRVLSPPEIALLVYSAHLHDAGMALSREERLARLAPESDLWDKLEVNPETKSRIADLQKQLSGSDLSKAARIRLESEFFQAEQFLLALDTRERHATPERYRQLIDQISEFHENDRARLPDPEQCFSFEGDLFQRRLVDICVSHNRDAEVLIEKDRETFELPRFPKAYPVGCATADLQMVAGALRLADILDFDRERTPPVLFHYLVPTALSVGDNISALEWSKHLAISNWEIGPEAIVFRGRSNNHVVHHAIVQFAGIIESEIAATRATFGVGRNESWPFQLPDVVKVEIVSEGYHYLPYRFELDDQRVYQLLMGRAIYSNPLDAVRELIQNAVDACRYRDALSKLYDPHSIPDTLDRITVTYEEPTKGRTYPVLAVADSGTGMDAWIVERFFLKVGRSYYSSGEFLRDRADLRKQGYDFAPVSEFGIGFLSSFLLADRVEVETAMWEPVRSDIRKRHLQIDGPTRLIKILESSNEGLKRFRGTRVKLHLAKTQGGKSAGDAVSWAEVVEYIRYVCQELPYRLKLQHLTSSGTTEEFVDASPLSVSVPPEYVDKVYRIPLQDRGGLIEGELAIVPYPAARRVRREIFEKERIQVVGEPLGDQGSLLLRGGFAIGRVSGLPRTWSSDVFVGARVRLKWECNTSLRHIQTNLARTAPADVSGVFRIVFETWMRYLLEHRHELTPGFLYGLASPHSYELREEFPFSATVLQEYDAFTLYELARNGWKYERYDDEKQVDHLALWERREASLRIGRGELYVSILELVLPRVAPERLFDEHGHVYIYPPTEDWREILRSWHTFMTEPIRWSRLVKYVGEAEGLLYQTWAGYDDLFNSAYATGLSGFTDEELGTLADVFPTLIEDHKRSRPTALSEENALLLERAIETFGDLKIRSASGTYPLTAFATRKSSG